MWEFTNEIKPVDLYCYLYAKFGEPNGIQNFLRSDDSDNLIHWEWTLTNEHGLISIQGHNFRTEVHLIGDFNNKPLTLQMFLDQIKSEMPKYGEKISDIRKKLEKWTQFVNPYHRIESAVSQQLNKLLELDINESRDKVSQPKNKDEMQSYAERKSMMYDKYSYAVGIIFGLRAMLPVLAESFVNLVLFVLAKPEIKQNKRLFENALRQPIDIRVQTLHLNCIGFKNSVDYTTEECKKFHTLMNDRNDLLHGNIEVSKLSIGDVYFKGNLPLFIRYEDFWDKSISVSMKSVKFNSICDDHFVVTEFIKFIIAQLYSDISYQIETIMKNGQLGYNSANGRVGILFPGHMVDFRALDS